MTTLDHDSRFASALEACAQRVRHGESLELSLADYPAEYRAELARLVPLSTQVGALAGDPSPAFQARLEQRLLDALEETQRARRVGLLSRLGRWFAAAPLARAVPAMLVFAVVLAGTGVGAVQAAGDSLPDSPLYCVKATKESVELLLARDDESKVGVHARQLGERGRELDRAVVAKKSRLVIDVLAVRLAGSTERIVDAALVLEAQGNRQPAARALALIRSMQSRVDRATVQASPQARPSLKGLRRFLEEQERRLTSQGVVTLFRRGS